MKPTNSYGQILKASSIMGGAAGITLLLGMLRVKFAAVFIGTTGVGLIASLGAVQGFIGTLAGFGLQSSAVREIAAAVGQGDEHAIGRTVLTLRRLCWLTGLTGMVAMTLLSPLLSQLTFGHRDHTLDIAALGLVILFGNLSGGQMALIQGMRRIGDLARANIFGATFGTVAAIGFYVSLGLRGIAPTLVAVSAFQLALSYYFARQVPVPKVELSWRQTFSQANGMVRLGLVFMSTALVGAVVTYANIALITRFGGAQAVGIYSAAYALSGVFVSFVLSAMGTDYYPRLTQVAGDKAAMGRMVNEQTEIGVLLALPGLLATMAFAPWVLQIFYTREFLPAADLLQWFVLGCLGRVISHPLSYVMLALGKGRWFLFLEVSFHLLHLTLIALGLHLFGLQGVAIAFATQCIGYIVAVHLLGRRQIAFRWSSDCVRLALQSLSSTALIFTIERWLPVWQATLLAGIVVVVISIYCLRELIKRIGYRHRIVRLLATMPGIKVILIR